jgi:hypothetical protein
MRNSATPVVAPVISRSNPKDCPIWHLSSHGERESRNSHGGDVLLKRCQDELDTLALQTEAQMVASGWRKPYTRVSAKITISSKLC